MWNFCRALTDIIPALHATQAAEARPSVCKAWPLAVHYDLGKASLRALALCAAMKGQTPLLAWPLKVLVWVICA